MGIIVGLVMIIGIGLMEKLLQPIQEYQIPV
jgi:hypothetical protein